MFISKSLKDKNIVEYLLYMWQVEDLLRANRLDLDEVRQNVVLQYKGLDTAQTDALLQWYDGLIEMMKREGIEKEGHLQINKNVLIELTDLHLKLSRSQKYPYYPVAYFKALPFIVEFRNRSRGTDKTEIENAMDMLYGVWMLKLQKREINNDTSVAMAAISQWMGVLSDYYRQDEAGELEF